VQIEENGKTYPARVTRLGGRVDPVSQPIKLIAEITEVFQKLVAGTSGQMTMPRPTLVCDHK
jgi:hypothetical protein